MRIGLRYVVTLFLLGVFIGTMVHHVIERCRNKTETTPSNSMSFPNFANKYKHSAILTPEVSLERKREVGRYPDSKPPRTIILCYDKRFMQSVLDKYNCEQCDGYFSNVFFFKDYPSVAIAEFGWFSPINSMGLELVIAWGVKQIIAIGSACGIQKDIKPGDILICDKAIRDEGASHHYLPSSKYVDSSKNLQNKIVAEMNQESILYRLGTTWTTDVFFRATTEEVKHYQGEGVMCIEGEASAVLSVAKFRKVDMAVMLTITDSYANLKWENAIDYQAKKNETFFKMLDIALKASV
jgi:uridine phosphorylase